MLKTMLLNYYQYLIYRGYFKFDSFNFLPLIKIHQNSLNNIFPNFSKSLIILQFNLHLNLRSLIMSKLYQFLIVIYLLKNNIFSKI